MLVIAEEYLTLKGNPEHHVYYYNSNKFFKYSKYMPRNDHQLQEGTLAD